MRSGSFIPLLTRSVRFIVLICETDILSAGGLVLLLESVNCEQAQSVHWYLTRPIGGNLLRL